MLVNIPGVKYPVAISTIAEYKELGDALAERTLTVLALGGGAMASSITQEAIDGVLSSDLSEAWKEDTRSLTPGPIISVLKDIIGRFSDEEQMAILLHEEGHIEAGDLALADSAPVNQFGIKILDDVEIEIKADAYAAARIGKEATRRAVVKSLWYATKAFARLNGRDHAEVLGEMLDSSPWQKRLGALL